ncbi:hypothetical protein LTR70_007853 [Exophiala xenobiotica]|uniref:Uncharacterized protein n=1 Tax=Lithohypha guttulata TaxID=1690604 RepID=A0ABR0JUT3_9EURO|nr:hypothetical protein LTR24_010160 [Lithohypha guttulata]KAK5313013.1 hypothetical protein LTR70_007853 [Exophiala xenobiotica]
MEDLTTGNTKKRKREYATYRTTKSVRKSKTPGVQVLSLHDDMTEIKQAEYRPHASLRCRQDQREMSFGTAIEDNVLASSPDSAQVSEPKPLNKTDLAAGSSVQGSDMFSRLIALCESLSSSKFSDAAVDSLRMRYFRHSIDFLGKERSLDDLRNYQNLAALKILTREKDITDAYESCEYEGIAEKHQDFVVACGGWLHKAQQRHVIGDSSLLNLLLEHNVPERWWKTGWQKFLDHIWTTGKMQNMDTHLQAAYTDVFGLRSKVPALREHWDECLKGLGHYSMKLHELYPGPLSPWKSQEDDGGGGNHRIDFSKCWHKPLSSVCRTVLIGWSIIGRTVKSAVYRRLGWVFCRVDKLWS